MYKSDNLQIRLSNDLIIAKLTKYEQNIKIS